MAGQDTVSLDNATDAIAMLLAEPVIKRAKEVLSEYDIPTYRYSFSKTGEDIVAVIYRDDTWKVIYTERGKEHIKDFGSTDEACRYLLFCVSDNDEKYNKMLISFEDKDTDNELKRISVKRIRDALKKAASSAAVF